MNISDKTDAMFEKAVVFMIVCAGLLMLSFAALLLSVTVGLR